VSVDRAIWLACLLLVAAVACWWRLVGADLDDWADRASDRDWLNPSNADATHAPTGAPSVSRGELMRLLAKVTVVDGRPTMPGYDRDCGPGDGCSFGPDWSDDVDVELGHNGCDTRNDLLARSLQEPTFRPNSADCVVVAGVLEADPYTGERIKFVKDRAYQLHVDHIYPLARAWDMGAAGWSEQRRRNFANDPRNLLVVSGSANSSKQDSGPGEWLPLSAGYRCAYLAQYLQVADVYRLPVTRADRAAVELLAPRCGAGTAGADTTGKRAASKVTARAGFVVYRGGGR
jgi:hypothetical protein